MALKSHFKQFHMAHYGFCPALCFGMPGEEKFEPKKVWYCDVDEELRASIEIRQKLFGKEKLSP